jgi:ethanolamine phosphate transferase 2 subunit G
MSSSATPPRSSFRTTAALVLANVLIPIAVVVFATGFFPYKPLLPGLATFEDGLEGAESDKEVQSPPVVFDRVVFMVVDALRSDFVFGDRGAMEFVQR